MTTQLPDIERFEQQVFKAKKPLAQLLDYSLDLLGARHVGLLYGTDHTGSMFLPPERWDRAAINRFNGRGKSGAILKLFGKQLVKMKGLSPVHLYQSNANGERFDNHGVIPNVLRKHKDFYKQGLKIFIIDQIKRLEEKTGEAYTMSIFSYNGAQFMPMPDSTVNTAIIKYFNAANFISAYVPDYGAIVFNTVRPELLERDGNGFLHESELKERLNQLILSIEMASLANLGVIRGASAIRTIRRKEKELRQTAFELQRKQKELDAQKNYLKSVGAVTGKQLNMEAVNVSDGVFAFVDMVKSATIRKHFVPKDYFYILNLCHQIAADKANQFRCRIDNFIGDAVFLQHTAIFDDEKSRYIMDVEERVMLMVAGLADYFNAIEQLKRGNHPLDPSGRVKALLINAGVSLDFRAGVEMGSAMVGPLGSEKRKIVTAIGKAVNNASRLESSGAPQYIQVNRDVKKILQNAYISEDTRFLLDVVNEGESKEKINGESYFSRFLDWYSARFKIDRAVFQKRNNISFKEFSMEKTYLIRTLPD